MSKIFQKKIIKENELEMLKLIKKIDINKYFITQKKRGISLDNIKDIKLTKKELEENILFLIKSLKFLHKNNITLRNIRLKNILYKKGEKMKFSNFGLSITKEKTKKLMLQKYKTVDDISKNYYLLYPDNIKEYMYLYKKQEKPLLSKLIDYISFLKLEDSDLNSINKELKKNKKTLLKEINLAWKYYKQDDIEDLKSMIKLMYMKTKNIDTKKLSEISRFNLTLTQIEKIIKKK